MFCKMFRTGLLVVALVAGLSLAAIAQGNDIPYKEKSTGQIISAVGNRQDWVAAGQGTHIGNYTESGFHTFNDDGTLQGEFTVTAADGSTEHGIYFGTFAVIGDTGFAQFDVDVLWLGGTRRLEGLAGAGTASAILDMATGEVVIGARGIWNLP